MRSNVSPAAKRRTLSRNSGPSPLNDESPKRKRGITFPSKPAVPGSGALWMAHRDARDAGGGILKWSTGLSFREQFLKSLQMFVVVAFLEGVRNVGGTSTTRAAAGATGRTLTGPLVAGGFQGFAVILDNGQDRLQPILRLVLGQFFLRFQALKLLREFLLFFVVQLDDQRLLSESFEFVDEDGQSVFRVRAAARSTGPAAWSPRSAAWSARPAHLLHHHLLTRPAVGWRAIAFGLGLVDVREGDEHC